MTTDPGGPTNDNAENASDARRFSLPPDDASETGPMEVGGSVQEREAHLSELQAENEVLRRSQQRLRDLSARYVDLYDFAPIGYAIVDSEGIVAESNLTLARLLRVVRSRIVGAPFSQFVVPDDQDAYARHRHALVGSGLPRTYRLRLQNALGEIAHVQIDAHPVKDELGAVLRCRMALTDITELMEAQAALRTSERRLQQAHELAQLGHWDWYTGADEVVLSPEVYRILGQDPATFAATAEAIAALIHPDDRERVLAAQGAALATGHTSGLAHRIVRPDGSSRHVLELVDITLDTLGNPVHVSGILQDTTNHHAMELERDRALEALARANQDLEGAQRIGKFGSWTWELSKDRAVWSSELCLLHGRDPALGAPPADEWWDHIHPDDRDPLREALQRAVDGLAPYNVTLRIRRYDTGEERSMHAEAEVVRDAEGRPRYLIGTAQDVTELRKIEIALRVTGTKLRTAMASADEGMWEADLATHRLVIDQVASEMLGYGSTSMDTTQEWFARQVHPDDSAAVQAAMEAYLRGRVEAFNVEFRIRRKDGGYIWVASNAQVLSRDADGLPTSLVGMHRDISDRKRAETALRDSNQQLREALGELREAQTQLVQHERLSAIGQLAAGIAHDFNNILASIMLYSQMAERWPGLPHEQTEWLRVISAEAGRGAELVQQILDFGRRTPIESRPISLAPFLGEVIDIVRPTLPDNIDVSLRSGADNYTITADPTRLQQVIVNSVLNAKHAMPRGGTLAISLSRTVPRTSVYCALCNRAYTGEWIQVAVTDTGTGMPPEVMRRIFEPYFTTRAPVGHGLGLAQVSGIVEQHGGHVNVETKVGHGTTFVFSFPALAAEVQPISECGKEEPATGRGQYILVVDDNDAARTALTEAVALLGYRALGAPSGQAALDKMRDTDGEVVLVVCEWVMRVMDGSAFVKILAERQPDVGVIAMTGQSMTDEFGKDVAGNVVGWLQKPIGLAELADALATALDRSGLPASIGDTAEGQGA